MSGLRLRLRLFPLGHLLHGARIAGHVGLGRQLSGRVSGRGLGLVWWGLLGLGPSRHLLVLVLVLLCLLWLWTEGVVWMGRVVVAGSRRPRNG